MGAVMKEVKMGMRRRGVTFMEEGRELRLPGLLYSDDLVLCGERVEDLRVMLGWFAEVCRRGLKFNAGKNKVMALNREEGLEFEVYVNRIHLEHVSEFKYLGCILGESATDGGECSGKVACGRKVAGAIRSLVNASDLQVECDMLNETLLVPVLMYSSGAM